MATSSSVRAEQRRAYLLSQLKRDGLVRLLESAIELGVSSMTVRRDLEELEGEGMLRRVRGGAVTMAGPRPFSERRVVRARAKRVIAHKAVALVPSAGAIGLDASTTAGMIGSALGHHSGVTVATNSYDNFLSARKGGGGSIVLVGGELEPVTGSFVGPVACQAAGSMLYQRFFASAAAIDPTIGTSEATLAESQVKQAFASVSRETVLCIDSSKFGDRSVALGFALHDIAIMITDLDPGDARLDQYRTLVELL